MAPQRPAGSAFNWAAVDLAQRRRLPHLVQPDVIYFVTFRLADSIAQSKLLQWAEELSRWQAANPPPHTPAQQKQYAELGYRRIERWLDRGEGSCLLRQGEPQEHLRACMEAYDGDRYWLGDYIVMPNHVHALVQVRGAAQLQLVVRAWRNASTHRINRQLGRHGRLWQDDWFDHIVRDDEALARIRAYIRNNARGLCSGDYLLGCGKLFQ
jgi:REP element-mobilizing transposase RayT